MTRIALISDIHYGRFSRTAEFSVPGEKIIDENTGGESLKEGITKETEFVLANTYAARYWLPMRADGTAKKINIRDNKVATYTVKMPGKKAPPSDQLSLWGDDAQ